MYSRRRRELHFAPTAAGSFTGSLIFTDSAGTSPQSVVLTGSGH
jgi:hypothetical protein